MIGELNDMMVMALSSDWLTMAIFWLMHHILFSWFTECISSILFFIIRLFLLVYGHVLHSPFVHGLFGGLIVPMNIHKHYHFKKRKKVAKKRKECLQDLDGFVAKNFVVCHQKSPKVTKSHRFHGNIVY